MNHLKNLIELMFRYLTLKEQANALYAEANKTERNIKTEYEHVKALCGSTGKTIFDVMEEMEDKQ